MVTAPTSKVDEWVNAECLEQRLARRKHSIQGSLLPLLMVLKTKMIVQPLLGTLEGTLTSANTNNCKTPQAAGSLASQMLSNI